MKTSRFHVQANGGWTTDKTCDRCHQNYQDIDETQPGYCPACAEIGKVIEKVCGVSRCGSVIYIQNGLGQDTELVCQRNGRPDVTGAIKAYEMLTQALATPASS